MLEETLLEGVACHLEPGKSLVPFQKRIASVLSDIGPFYAHFGGAGDALLLLSTFLDQRPDSIVVSYPNSVRSAKSLFDSFPEIKRVYFIPQASDPMIAFALRQVLPLLPNFQGMGVTPCGRYEEEWHPHLNVFQDCGVQQHPEWLKRFQTRKDPNQVAVTPRGSTFGDFGSRRNGIDPRLWPDVIRALTDFGLQPVILGVPEEGQDYPCSAGCVDRRSYSYRDQMETIAGSGLLVGADSWGKTFAAMARIPAITFAPPAPPKDSIHLSHFVFLNPWRFITVVRDFSEFEKALAWMLKVKGRESTPIEQQAGNISSRRDNKTGSSATCFPKLSKAKDMLVPATASANGSKNCISAPTSIPVLFDVSLFRVTHKKCELATETMCAAENLAASLFSTHQCDLKFSALDILKIGDGVDSVREAITTRPRLSQVPFSAGRLTAFLDCHWTRYKTMEETRGYKTFTDKIALEALRTLRRAMPNGLRKSSLKALEWAEILHVPAGGCVPALRGLAKLKVFQTVRNAGPLRDCGYFGPFSAWKYGGSALQGQRDQFWFFVNSQYTKDEVCEEVRDLDPGRVFVTNLAAAVYFAPAPAAELEPFLKGRDVPDGPYFLFRCPQRPSKEAGQVVRAFCRLSDEIPSSALNLVLLGCPTWQAELLINQAKGCSGAAKRIVCVETVAEQDLPLWYSGSLGFIYCLLPEGLGIPALEAMQCGAPVIAGKRMYLPEILGSAALFFQPGDEAALSEAMHKLYRDPELQQTLRDKGLEQARQFSWTRCAQETLAGYAKALGQTAPSCFLPLGGGV
jgi:hypothetical protein